MTYSTDVLETIRRKVVAERKAQREATPKIPWLFHYLDNKNAYRLSAMEIMTHNIDRETSRHLNRHFVLKTIHGVGLCLYDGDILLRCYMPNPSNHLTCYFESVPTYILSRTVVRVLDKHIIKTK